MKRARQRLIKSAAWEIRYHTRLSFFDRAGSALQPFLEESNRELFSNWTYSLRPPQMELKNPTTFTRFVVGPQQAAATTENLDVLRDYGAFCGRALAFLDSVADRLGVASAVRLGHRIQYLVETRGEFQPFAQAIARQLTTLGHFGSTASDLTVIWISENDGTKSRWAVAPLAIREFPAWFQSTQPPPGASGEEKRFYPKVSLVIDVDVSREESGEGVPLSDMRSFFEGAFRMADEQALALADRLREE